MPLVQVTNLQRQQLLNSFVHLVFRSFCCFQLPHAFTLSYDAGEQVACRGCGRSWGCGGGRCCFGSSGRLKVQRSMLNKNWTCFQNIKHQHHPAFKGHSRDK